MCFGDFNGHVGRHIDGFNRLQGGYGVGQRNFEGRMLLVLSGEGIMCQIQALGDRKGKVTFKMAEKRQN